jgi:HEPN domain-containing protein
MKKLTREWVQKAEEDWAVVAKLSKGKPVLNSAICFHCQQAAEKFLKALMQEFGLAIPYIHDILELVNRLVVHENRVKPLRRGAGSLSDLRGRLSLSRPKSHGQTMRERPPPSRARSPTSSCDSLSSQASQEIKAQMRIGSR